MNVADFRRKSSRERSIIERHKAVAIDSFSTVSNKMCHSFVAVVKCTQQFSDAGTTLVCHGWKDKINSTIDINGLCKLTSHEMEFTVNIALIFVIESENYQLCASCSSVN